MLAIAVRACQQAQSPRDGYARTIAPEAEESKHFREAPVFEVFA
jgi:hypothetical protein